MGALSVVVHAVTGKLVALLHEFALLPFIIGERNRYSWCPVRSRLVAR